MTLPIIQATFSIDLDMPPAGHTGKMSQPYWIPIGDAGRGFFILYDESVLYVLDSGGSVIWQLNARLTFSGLAVDVRTLYIVDGHVLFRYDLEILQKQFLALPSTQSSVAESKPQRAYNLVSGIRYSPSPPEGNLATIYDLKDESDKTNLKKITEARCLRSWMQLIQEAQIERRRTQVRLLAKKGDETHTDKFDELATQDLQLAGLIDDARFLLGAASPIRDRSCHALFIEKEARARSLESEAASLRFSAPVVRRDRNLDGHAVFVINGLGAVTALSASLSNPVFSGKDVENPPAALAITIDENADRSTHDQLSGGW